LHVKLGRLIQGGKCKEGCYKDMELTIMKTYLEDNQDETMTRSLHRINKNIQVIVELHECKTLFTQQLTWNNN